MQAKRGLYTQSSVGQKKKKKSRSFHRFVIPSSSSAPFLVVRLHWTLLAFVTLLSSVALFACLPLIYFEVRQLGKIFRTPRFLRLKSEFLNQSIGKTEIGTRFKTLVDLYEL